MTEEAQPHTQLTTKIATKSAVIVGDPARVDKAAKLLDDVQDWAFNREYKSIIGNYRGRRILVMSTGIGAPSAAIGIEELHNVGVDRVIRVGSAGAMQSGIGLGQLIISEGAVRDDGLTKNYVPNGYPAVPDFELLKLAHRYASNAAYGIIRSHDGFYMDDNAKIEKYWSSKGIIGADMESGAMMVVGRLRGMKTLSILNNVVLYEGDLAAGVNNLVSGDELIARGETASLKLAFDILSDQSLEE